MRLEVRDTPDSRGPMVNEWEREEGGVGPRWLRGPEEESRPA
jgi:hypothetical protein